MNRIELLAPCGDYNCFLAAINAGADAVYLSGEKFGARAYAKNFSKEELLKAIDYAHIFNRKVFMTVNTLLKDSEILELYDYLLPYYEAGLDGVIVQDIGVISYIRRVFNDLPVHASTQLAITGIEGIKLLERFGVVRTVLARELSMSEIEHIHNNSKMELETFVHGSLCYSYSGKCLFSSFVGGRSGNRGRCAGPCRQPYNNEQYLLSTKDICCLSIIPEMIKAGISSLKIEGRMKSPEYVAGVTAIYRKYIDYYYDNINKMSYKDIKTTYFSGKEFNYDRDILTKLYTRGGNSEGYYYKKNGKEMISLSDASYKSDKGEIKNEVNNNYISNHIKKELDAYVRIYPNENISILINNEYYYEGKEALIAENRPIDKEVVLKQLKKTKDTEFEFNEIDIDISDNVFVRVSDLNELRREALNGYKSEILKKYRRKKVFNTRINDKAKSTLSYDNVPVINCEVLNKEQLYTIISYDEIDGAYIPFELLKDKNILEDLKNNNKKIYIKFPSVIRNNYLEKNKNEIISLFDKIDGVLADSNEVVQFFIDNNFSKEIIGDIHIYALNSESKNVYNELGVDKITVPVELNKKELLNRELDDSELIIYGYIPMMVSAQCVNNTLSKCDHNEKIIIIKDRLGAEFKALNMCNTCINTVYNNVPLALQGEKAFIKKLNPKSLRIVLSIETVLETRKILEYFIDYLKKDKEDIKPIFSGNDFTKGHLNRGVL